MAVEVTKILPDREWKHTVSGAAATNGQIVQVAHKIGVIEGLQSHAIGDTVTVRLTGIAFIPSASATTFAAGADVQFNTTTRLAVTSGGVHAGRAIQAKVNGELGVYVYLNDPPAPA